MAEPTGWHLDKKVPIALIVTLIAQAGMFIWWASSMDARVAAIEARLVTLEDSRERLIRLEAAAAHQSDTLNRIAQRLDEQERAR